MKNITTLFICLFAMHCFAQSFEWATPDGGYNEDRGFGIAADNNGNVYVTGFFSSTATFGTYTFNSAGVQDIFLAKYSPAGVLLWAKQFGGQSNDYGHAVAVDEAGNCYLAGSYRGEVTFGSFTLQSTTFQDTEALLLKVDPNGNVLWARKGGGADWDEARGVTVAGDHVYITGLFSETATFDDTTITTIGMVDMFVASYDLDGNMNWFSRGGGLKSETGFDIASDAAGNAYVTGHFQGGQTDFGPVSVTNNGNWYADMFVVKLDPAGNFLWARAGGTVGNDDAGRGIAVDADGNVYVAGEVRDEGTFDGLTYNGADIADIYVAKYDTSGTIQYLKQFGGGGGDYAYDVAAYGNNVYITGLINGTVSFGSTTLSSQGSNDIYVAAINGTTGDVIGAMRAGGLGNDAGQAMCATAIGTYVTGDFEHDSSTFQPFVLNSNGTHDVFTGRVNFGPMSPAPIPIPAPENVISMFSDSYENVPVNTWNASWSAATLQDVQIVGNNAKRYTALDFNGIETTGVNLINASSMQYFHIDIWTPNMTAFRVKLVDFGADGLYQGADDSEHELEFIPQLNGWNSFDIPLTDFTGLASKSHIAQLILSGNPAGFGELYIDNVYFSNEALGNTNFNASTFAVYPNPSTGQINISSDDIIDTIEVYNMLGQRVMTLTPSASTLLLDISTLSKGIYVIKSTMNTVTVSRSIVKE
jgi:hypothetical protein